MMMNKDLMYMDSCCFIDMAKIDLNKIDLGITEARKQDAWFLKKLCDASYNGDIQIITSTLTIAECLHTGDGSITDRAKDLFIKLLTSDKVVKTIAAEIFVAEKARDLCWKHNIILSGADAIHVASALIMECKEFITTDEKLLRNKKLFNAVSSIEKLGLKIIRASATNLLPIAYRQDSLIEEESGETLEKEEGE